MRLGFFLRESLRALRRNAAPSIAAGVVVIVTTLVLGVFIPVMGAVTSKANDVRDKIEVAVYVEPDSTRSQLDELRNQIVDIQHVESVKYLTPEQGKDLLRQEVDPDLLNATGGRIDETFPGTFLIKPEDPAKGEAIKNSLEPVGSDGRPRPISPIIQKDIGVELREDETEQILSATRTIKFLLGGLTLLLVLASILLIANTIRLSIFARRREVEVMRLVGATNWFIRWPFVIEGLVVGLFGGLVAVALLWLAKVTVIDPWSDQFALIAAPDTINFTILVIVLLGAAMAVSALGSGITLRRFLRI
jgi:cell division transport system permease protein